MTGMDNGGTEPRHGRRSSARPRKLRRHRKAERQTEALIDRFDESVRQFEASTAFPGPSLYFHERAIERRRSAESVDELLDDTRFLEYVYAVLPSWGMHRMGTSPTKVRDFEDVRRSLDRNRQGIAELSDLTITAIPERDRQKVAEALWNIIGDLEVSTSRTRIVAGSKTLHHVLPDLVPPIDREYTFRFFVGRKSVHFGDDLAFKEWFPLLAEAGARAAPVIREARERGGFMATGDAKIVDNAIMGFMQLMP